MCDRLPLPFTAKAGAVGRTRRLEILQFWLHFVESPQGPHPDLFDLRPAPIAVELWLPPSSVK